MRTRQFHINVLESIEEDGYSVINKSTSYTFKDMKNSDNSGLLDADFVVDAFNLNGDKIKIQLWSKENASSECMCSENKS